MFKLSDDRIIYFPTFYRPPPDIIQRNKFDTLTTSANEIHVTVIYELNDVSLASSKTLVVQLTADLHSIVNVLFKSCFISDVIVLFVDESRAWLCIFLALKLMFVVVSALVYFRDCSMDILYRAQHSVTLRVRLLLYYLVVFNFTGAYKSTRGHPCTLNGPTPSRPAASDGCLPMLT